MMTAPQDYGPPAAAAVQQQQQGPFSMAGQQGQPQQQGSPQQGQQLPSDDGELFGEMQVAVIHMRQMLRRKPALAPWVNSAINQLETGVRTMLAQAQQSPGMPVSSATPPNEPGAGLPM